MMPICFTQALKARQTHASVTCPGDCWARSSGLGNGHWAVAGGVSSCARRACQVSTSSAVWKVIGSRRRSGQRLADGLRVGVPD